MSGYYGPPLVLARCTHGLTPFDHCETCRAEREAAELADRRRVHDPAQVIVDAIARRRRWFDGCAFCPRAAALVVRSLHEHDCPFVVAVEEAKVAYGLHLVATFDPASVFGPTTSENEGTSGG